MIIYVYNKVMIYKYIRNDDLVKGKIKRFLTCRAIVLTDIIFRRYKLYEINFNDGKSKTNDCFFIEMSV